MIHLLKTKVGRLRILGFLEGFSLAVLVFIAVPAKYIFHNPDFSKTIGPIHGAIFIIFMLNVMSVGIEQNWKFRTITWKIVLASFIPFGTMYIDHKIFKNIKEQ